MTKIENAEVYTENGQLMVRYDINSAKGIRTVELPYYNEKGEENPEVQNALLAAKKSDLVNKVSNKINKSNSEELVVSPESKMINSREIEQASKSANVGFFKKHGKTIAKCVAFAGLGFAVAFFGKGCSAKDVTPSTSYTQEFNQFENQADQLDYNTFLSYCANASGYLNDDMKLGVSASGISSMMFACNYQYMGTDDITKLVQNGVISSSPENVMQSALEVSNAIHNNNFLATTDAKKEIIDYSFFCTNSNDKIFVSYIYEQLSEAQSILTTKENKTEEDNKRLASIFYDYYHYMCGEGKDKTSYPNTIQSGTATQQFLAGKYLSAEADIATRTPDVNQADIHFLENDIKNSGAYMSESKLVAAYDLSTVFAGVRQGCETVQDEVSKTR